jgi:hypothetical protein
MALCSMALVAVAGSGRVAAQTPLVAGGLTSLPQAIVGPDLLQNGGFETVSGGMPAGWSGGPAWATDEVVKRAGAVSYRRETGAPTAVQHVTLAKGVYKLSAWVRTDNLGPSGGGVRLLLDYRPGGLNEWVASKVISGTTDWTLYEVGPIVVTTERQASVSLESYDAASGTAWFDDVKLQAQLPHPVDVFMLYPNYRGMLFDDQSPTMKFDVTVTPPAGGDLARYTIAATLADETSATVVASRTYPAAAHLIAEIPGAQMQTGRAYLVQLALVDAATHVAVYTYPAYRVAKVSGAQRAAMHVAFDEKNRVLVRGTPRFVLGVYDAGAAYGRSDAFWEDHLWSSTGERRMQALKINMYLNYWHGAASATAVTSLMANLDRHGVGYLQTGNCFATWPAGPSNVAIDSSDAHVRAVASQAGSAGYYTVDECASSRVPEAFAQYQRLKALDPGSVTFAALLGSPSDTLLWRDSADIISTDPAPVYGDEPTGGYRHNRVADWTDAARAAVKSARPYMTVLQFSQLTSQGRWPSRQEMRNHAWTAIVEGARGLWWWSLGDNALGLTCADWCAERTQHMDDLKAVVNEIADLEPALLADDAPAALTSNSNATAIRTKVKVVDGRAYLFAYNYTGAAASATFGWSMAPGAVRVNAEGRTLAASGRSFSDTFGPYQAHVYVINDTTDRSGTTSVTATVRN